MPKECGIDINSKSRIGFPWIPSLINSKKNVNSMRGGVCSAVLATVRRRGHLLGSDSAQTGQEAWPRPPMEDHMQLVQHPQSKVFSFTLLCSVLKIVVFLNG